MENIQIFEEKSNISTHIIQNLPGRLRGLADIVDPVERDISVLSAFVGLSSCMPNITSIYRGDPIAPHHYLYVVGPPESGKGCIQVASSITKYVNESIYKDYLARKKLYDNQSQEDNGEEDKIPKPAVNKLFISDDITGAAFVRAIMVQNPTGSLLVSTEAGTLVKSLGKEHGGFLGQLLKAWGHEMINKDLIQYDEYVCCDFPKLSMVLASNFRDFQRFLGEANSSGLLSRLLLYSTKKIDKHISLLGTPNRISTIEGLRSDCYNMFLILSQKPRKFVLSDNQRELWENLMNNMASHIHDLNPSAEFGILRFAISVFRQLIVISVYRAFCENRVNDIIYPCMNDFNAIIDFAYTQAYHALGVYDMAPNLIRSVVNIFTELKDMPETFNSSDFIKKLVVAGLSARTAARRLAELKLSGRVFETQTRGVLSKKMPKPDKKKKK